MTARILFAVFSIAFLSFCFSFGTFGPMGLSILVPVFGAIFFLSSKKASSLALMSAILFWIAVAGGAFGIKRIQDIRFLSSVQRVFVASSENAEISGIVTRVTALGIRVSTDSFGVSGNIFLRMVPGAKPLIGESISAQIHPNQQVPLSPFESSLASRGTAVGFVADSVNTLEGSTDSWFKKIRDSLSQSLKRLYPPEESALARGMILGDGSGISDAMSDAYRKSGLSHLVVASGGNIAIFSGILYFFIRWLAPKFSVGILLLGIWGYFWLAGGEIPILRAAIMATVATAFRPIARVDSINLLLAVAVAFLIFDPDLSTDASFLLSFSATLGLCLFSEKIDRWLVFAPWFLGFRSSVAASISAGLSTLPISLGSFGSISTVSILSNIFVAITLLPAILSAIIAMLLDSIGFHQLADILAFPGYVAFRFITLVSVIAKDIPYGYIENIAPNFWAGVVILFGLLTGGNVLLRNAIPSPSPVPPNVSEVPKEGNSITPPLLPEEWYSFSTQRKK